VLRWLIELSDLVEWREKVMEGRGRALFIYLSRDGPSASRAPSSDARFSRRQEGVGGSVMRVCEVVVGLLRGGSVVEVNVTPTRVGLREQNMVRAAPSSGRGSAGRRKWVVDGVRVCLSDI
jgi:hypothetical protein